jgi:hypothetical protein
MRGEVILPTDDRQLGRSPVHIAVLCQVALTDYHHPTLNTPLRPRPVDSTDLRAGSLNQVLDVGDRVNAAGLIHEPRVIGLPSAVWLNAHY